MSNKQKLLIKTLNKIKARAREYSLAFYKKNIIDKWETDYHVDLDIQRNPYFTFKHAISYLQAWFIGADLSFITMVDIPSIWNELETENQKGTKTYNYFKRLYEKTISWLSVDGNNRNHAWYWFFTDQLELPKGFNLPLWNNNTGEQYFIELPRKMTYSDIISEYGDEFEAYMMKGDERVRIMEIQKCTKPQLHNIFRCINQGKKLEHQEDRNCIDVAFAEWVRRTANDEHEKKVSFGNFFKSQYNEKSIDKRAHEHFTAWTSSMIQQLSCYFPTLFGEKPDKEISENIVTKHYEDETITDETMKDTKSALEKLKDFVKWTNSGMNYISSNLQFSRALTMIFHKIRKNYTDIQWKEIYVHLDKFHQKMLNEDRIKKDKAIAYNFNHKSDSRTYTLISTSGTAYLSIIYQFLASQLTLMELNGMMKSKLARGSFGHDVRKDLYEIQNHTCPLTGNKIVGYNDGSKYHVDHIIPISKWLTELNGQDPNHISNLQLVEKTANLNKSDKILTQTSIDKFVDVDEEEELEVA